MAARLACTAGAALVCAACLLHEARATRAADMPPPTAEAVRRAAAAVAASGASASVGGSANASATALAERQRLREGVVDALDIERGRVRIDGVWMHVADGRTRVIRFGRASDISSDISVIAPGQRLRFTLAGDAAAAPTLGLVYVP